MRFAFLAAVVALASLMLMPFGAGAEQKAKKSNELAVSSVTENGQAVEGVFTITQFVEENGQIVAHGSFKGKVDGKPSKTDDAFAPVTGMSMTDPTGGQMSIAAVDPVDPGECNVLYLELGPLTLNLLGLEVELPNPLIINIDADPSGGLLGQLLCSLAGGPTGGGLLDILNGLLGGLTNLVDFLNGIVIP